MLIIIPIDSVKPKVETLVVLLCGNGRKKNFLVSAQATILHYILMCITSLNSIYFKEKKRKNCIASIILINSLIF